MDAISPTFRLDSERDFRGIDLSRDWVVSEKDWSVFYRPAALWFAIIYYPPPDGCLNRLGLAATFRQTRARHDAPPLAELRQLGKDAIHAFILSKGLFGPPPRILTDDAAKQRPGEE